MLIKWRAPDKICLAGPSPAAKSLLSPGRAAALFASMHDQDSSPAAGHTLHVQQLFVQHQAAIKGFILSLRPDFAEAQDVLQETFLTVTRKAAEFQAGSNFVAWSFSIARFKVLESARAHRRETELSAEVLDTLAAEAPAEGAPESHLFALRACLDRLAPRAREVVRLRYHEEQAPGAIAARLAWGVNAVHVALARARVALRQCVEKQGRSLVETGHAPSPRITNRVAAP